MHLAPTVDQGMEEVKCTQVSNIFLDFLNRDSRQIYGLFDNYDRASHLDLLTEALNIAVFLTAEFCIIPPGFIAECDIVREILFKRRIEFLDQRLIRWPMKETNWDLFFNKKRREYRPFKNLYKGLYDHKVMEALGKHSINLMPRISDIGNRIVESWEEGPDQNGIWQTLVIGVDTETVEKVRGIPRLIQNNGTAVTWKAIQGIYYTSVGKGLINDKFRYGVQYHYFKVYIDEYQLKIIGSLPFASSDFMLGEMVKIF